MYGADGAVGGLIWSWEREDGNCIVEGFVECGELGGVGINPRPADSKGKSPSV